ncbi:MAG TPA: hypothetical protein VK435_02850 [Thermodesulfovibrionales bacterium]|nr:hypothetical protein [Thermodesulfovibrionales bacterium]
MRGKYFLAVLFGIMFLFAAGCQQGKTGPKELLDKYFSAAIKQDYATAYSCYYDAYKAKVSQDEYIKHRKEASVLQSYKIVSVKQEGDTASAEVQLTFAPSEKLKRKEPVTSTVTEEMIKENGAWKIKVW